MQLGSNGTGRCRSTFELCWPACLHSRQSTCGLRPMARAVVGEGDLEIKWRHSTPAGRHSRSPQWLILDWSASAWLLFGRAVACLDILRCVHASFCRPPPCIRCLLTSPPVTARQRSKLGRAGILMPKQHYCTQHSVPTNLQARQASLKGCPASAGRSLVDPPPRRAVRLLLLPPPPPQQQLLRWRCCVHAWSCGAPLCKVCPAEGAAAQRPPVAEGRAVRHASR